MGVAASGWLLTMGVAATGWLLLAVGVTSTDWLLLLGFRFDEEDVASIDDLWFKGARRIPSS